MSKQTSKKTIQMSNVSINNFDFISKLICT